MSAVAIPSAGRYLLPLLALPSLLVAGCQGTDRLDWKPAPVVASIEQILPGAKRREAWQRWAAGNLQNGDLLFVQGESRILMGLVNFSALCTELADSDFSHVALVACEEGQWVVYDTVLDGPRRTPFEAFMADRRVWKIAVKRLRPDSRSCIPGAIAYCRDVYESGIGFDDEFRLNNDRLYCSEFIELAFRHAGLKLSDPVRVKNLPGFGNISPATMHLVQAATGITPDQPVLLPGNATSGIWSSPHLELVLDLTDASSAPSAAE